jgi:hypothetical protein
VIDNTTEMPIVQSNTSYEYLRFYEIIKMIDYFRCLSSRKREFIWILFSAIATILIPLATIITTIVVIEENIQANKSTMNTINTGKVSRKFAFWGKYSPTDLCQKKMIGAFTKF